MSRENGLIFVLPRELDEDLEKFGELVNLSKQKLIGKCNVISLLLYTLEKDPPELAFIPLHLMLDRVRVDVPGLIPRNILENNGRVYIGDDFQKTYREHESSYVAYKAFPKPSVKQILSEMAEERHVTLEGIFSENIRLGMEFLKLGFSRGIV
jgi:hypothetical protein